VKTRLKEKDKLLHQSFDWILSDPDYLRWQDGTDVCLLWIKGGAGKGKTMMSIGLIEELSKRPKGSNTVLYFFCQNANYELNTVESIIKGLILQLIKQQKELAQSLRDRWDVASQRFTEDVTSWRGLWDILMEILDRCSCACVYVIVDALDECDGNGMAGLLRTLVRTGLCRHSPIKWLVTSRPLDSAEMELLSGSEQVLVSLELNAEHISRGVTAYIADKVGELDRRHKYRAKLRQAIQTELEAKAEDTFLWVSLVCKQLEQVGRHQALSTIQSLPPGLHPFYDRILHQISKGEPDDVNNCMRLLTSMTLTYRPLNILEVSNVAGLPAEEYVVEDLVDRCASFVKLRGAEIEFVHQSARDYLTGDQGQAILSSHDTYEHGDIARNCLSHISKHLTKNLLGLPQPNSTRDTLGALGGDAARELLSSLGYAATFWARHFHTIQDTRIVQDTIIKDGLVDQFLRTKFLEWLECLSLLDQLPQVIEALSILSEVFYHRAPVSSRFCVPWFCLADSLSWFGSRIRHQLLSKTPHVLFNDII